MFPIRDPRNDAEYLFGERISQPVEELVRSVSVPVFAANKNALSEVNGIFVVEGKPIKGLGSATLFQVGEHRFLITAAHVVDQLCNDHTELRIGGGEPNRPMPFNIEDDAIALDEKNDIAAIKIPSSELGMFANKRFLSLSEIDFANEIEDWHCMLFGYLWTGSGASHDSSRFLLHNHTLWTRQSSQRVLANSFIPEQHLLLNYSGDSWSMKGDQQKTSHFNLAGISGSSLWKTFRPCDVEGGWSISVPKVIGVENLVYDDRVIRCTKWKEVLSLLTEIEPGVCSYLEGFPT